MVGLGNFRCLSNLNNSVTLSNESSSPLSGVSDSVVSPAPALASISHSTGPEGMTESVGECKMKVADIFVSCPGALFVLIWRGFFLSFPVYSPCQ